MKKHLFLFSIVLFTNFGQSQNLKLSFSQSLDYSNQNNPFLKSQFVDLEITQLEYEKSKTRSNPIFNTQILSLLDHSYFPNKALFISEYNRQDWFQLTKKIQPWGQRKNNIKYFQHQTSQKKYELEGARYENKYMIASKWLDAWYALIIMEVSKSSVQSLKNLMSDEFKDTSSLSYLRYSILDDQYDMRSIDAQNDYERKISDLKLNIAFAGKMDIDTNNFFYLKIPSLDSLILFAENNRYDILQKKEERSSINANIKLQKSLSVPGPEIGLIANPQNRIPYAGIFLTQPIPVFDRNHKNINIAKLTSVQNKYETEASLLKLRADISMKHQIYNSQLLKKTQMKLAETKAEKLLIKVREAYAENKKVEVDMWEAEFTWFEVQKLYYESDFDLRKSYIELLYVSGLL